MILIADSGSTKTDWALVDNHQAVKEIKTQGLNPFQVSGEQIAAEIRSALLPHLPTTEVDAVYFYGAGCTPEKQPIVEQALRDTLTIRNHCTVASDMLGAAIAVCGHEPGIACILGTGSNSCAYDGERIVKNVSPLGFILGDEGSGTAIGKAFFRLIYRNPKAASLREKFEAWSGKDYAAVIERIYRQPLANTYLASVSTFVGEHLSSLSAQEHLSQDEQIEKKLLSAMLHQVYGDFCREILSFYAQLANGAKEDSEMPSSVKVGFVGSIAHYFHDEIANALHELGFQMGEVLKSPMEGLIRYHTGY